MDLEKGETVKFKNDVSVTDNPRLFVREAAGKEVVISDPMLTPGIGLVTVMAKRLDTREMLRISIKLLDLSQDQAEAIRTASKSNPN